MNRWSQDTTRLPEGMIRVAYDADTGRYTFRDEKGVLYQGAPGEEYGVMTPVSCPRAHLFASDKPRPKIVIITEPNPEQICRSPMTFEDILHPDLMTSPSKSKDYLSSSSSPRSYPSSGKKAFQDSVRKVSSFPRMHGVVQNLKRSLTVSRIGKSNGQDGDRDGLLQRDPSQKVSPDIPLGR